MAECKRSGVGSAFVSIEQHRGHTSYFNEITQLLLIRSAHKKIYFNLKL